MDWQRFKGIVEKLQSVDFSMRFCSFSDSVNMRERRERTVNIHLRHAFIKHF